MTLGLDRLKEILMKRKQGLGYQRSFSIEQDTTLKRRDLEKILFEIFDEHSSRKRRKVSPDDGSATKNESAKNFLRREIYALGYRIQNSGSGKLDANSLLEAMGRTTTRPEKLKNVFHALLFFVYEGEQGFPRQERSKLARELEYAYRHRIPPELLCGFLFQSSNRNKLSKLLKSGFIEPAFRDALS